MFKLFITSFILLAIFFSIFVLLGGKRSIERNYIDEAIIAAAWAVFATSIVTVIAVAEHETAIGLVTIVTALSFGIIFSISTTSISDTTLVIVDAIVALTITIFTFSVADESFKAIIAFIILFVVIFAIMLIIIRFPS